ncbi:MAG: helix-turn-helix domain-containing protein [Pseudomonadota bacterium]
MNASHVLQALSHHRGARNGISAAALAKAVGISARLLRRHITTLREDGIAVCGHPSSGYYIAATPEELDRACQFLRARALHSLKLEAQLRRVPLEQLVGQMKLPT